VQIQSTRNPDSSDFYGLLIHNARSSAPLIQWLYHACRGMSEPLLLEMFGPTPRRPKLRGGTAIKEDVDQVLKFPDELLGN
jgi:hypothetical protein